MASGLITEKQRADFIISSSSAESESVRNYLSHEVNDLLENMFWADQMTC